MHYARLRSEIMAKDLHTLMLPEEAINFVEFYNFV